MICYTLLEDLRPAVDLVRKFAAGPKSLPVLRNVLLLAKDDALIVGASNLETFCWTAVPAAIAEDFATTVEAKTLYGLLEKNRTGVVELEVGKDLRLDLAGRILTLPTIKASDFPTLPESQPGAAIDAKAFVEAVNHVADFVGAYKYGREPLTGIRWTDKGMIATDGARAAMAKLDGLPTCTVPGLAKVATAISKTQAKTITIGYAPNRNQVLIECNQLHFAISCIDGAYPDVSKYIDYAAPTSAVVATEDLLPTLKSLHVIARERDGEKKDAIGLHLNGVFDLTAESRVGRSTFSLPYVKTGPDVDLAINGEWLRDLVKNLHAESVTLRMSSPQMPILVSATDKPHLTAAIMPTKGA